MHWILHRTRYWYQTWALTLVVSEKLRRKRFVKLHPVSYRRTFRKYQWAPIQTFSLTNKKSKLAKWEIINQPFSTMSWLIQLLTLIFSPNKSLVTPSMTFQAQEALYRRNKAHQLKSSCNRKCNTKASQLIIALPKIQPSNKANKVTNRCKSWSTKWS